MIDDLEIERAFTDIEEKFTTRRNDTGLDILANIRANYERFGGLTENQLGWVRRQLDGSWRQPSAADGSHIKVERSAPGSHVDQAPLAQRAPRSGAHAIELATEAVEAAQLALATAQDALAGCRGQAGH